MSFTLKFISNKTYCFQNENIIIMDQAYMEYLFHNIHICKIVWKQK